MNERSMLRGDERAGILLRELYGRHGYLPYHMSKFEPYDLYARNKRFLVSENILTFTDTDGRLMALKPDVTLSIVKNAPDNPAACQKVCYQENVYRACAGGYREIMQAGLECIGRVDLLDMAEVLSLAAESLALLGPDYLLDIGHMGIISGMLEGLGEAERTGLLAEIGRKNVSAIRELCARSGVAHRRAEGLCGLARLYGTPAEALPQLEKLTGSAQAAVEELKSLCALLEDRGLAEHVRLDFSITNDMSYYNGVIFRGYLPGLSGGVLSGGRYDNLLCRMGKSGGAIGFAVYLDQLERLGGEREYDVDMLLLCGRTDDPAAVARQAARLRAGGRSVRVEAGEPQGLRWRELVRFGEEA